MASNQAQVWGYIFKVLGISIPVLAICIGFYVQSKLERAVIKEDLYFYKQIYEKNLVDYKEDKEHFEKRLDKIDRKETINTELLRQIQSDVRIIKHELKINGHK